MADRITVPGPDDKVGLKIDYLAKRLALALAPMGFKRKGRSLLASVGDGIERHWKIVHLAAGRWNEGSRGEFYVSLVVQFPGLTQMLAKRPGQEWLLDYVDKPDVAVGQVREGLGHLVAGARASGEDVGAWVSGAMKIAPEADLPAMAASLERAIQDHGWPWLAAQGSLRAVADCEGPPMASDNVLSRIAAAVAMGDMAGAQRIVDDRLGRWAHSDASYLSSVRAWLPMLGLDVSSLPARPAPSQPSEWERERQAKLRAETARHAAEASAIRAAMVGTADTTMLARAWIAEYRSKWDDEPNPLKDLPTGQHVAALAIEDRESVLLALLGRLADAEAKTARSPTTALDVKEAELDEAIRPVVEALLSTLPEASEATLAGVLQSLKRLVRRRHQDLVTSRYLWPFASLVRWLGKVGGARHRARLKGDVADWLELFASDVLAKHEAMTAKLHAWRSKPLDPASPDYEFMKEWREREQEAHAKQPPVDESDLLRRVAEYPEQVLGPEDKRAVGALRRELSRDDRTGTLPVSWDADEWGQRAWVSWREADGDAWVTAVTPTLQLWMEGVDTKPSQRWLRDQRQRVEALTPEVAAVWRRWSLSALEDFVHCSGETEWAMTGARPGKGARLGDHSESLLLGMLWWVWLDAGIDNERLARSLISVAEGAWQHLPEVGARSQGVGGLVLRMLAGIGPTGSQYVTACLAARSKQKKQAAARALKESVPGR